MSTQPTGLRQGRRAGHATRIAGRQGSGGAFRRTTTLLRFALKYRHLISAADTRERESAEDAAAFAHDIEALGPAFIKIGQALSIRPDLLPPAYSKALEQLQDDIDRVSFETIRATIETDLGVRLDRAFETFDPEPLAAASLAQVHAATLRGGRAVAVKVQRPRIREDIRADLAVLSRLARAVDSFTEQGRRVLFEQWIAEMSDTLAEELDYRREADNLRAFRGHLLAYQTLQVPAPIDDYTRGRVLTMERIEGTKVGTAINLRRLEQPLGDYAKDLLRAYLDQIFVNGLVHADPHPGNVMLTQSGLALVDLGMVARLSPRTRDALFCLFGAAIEGEGDEVARQTIELGERFEFFDEARWLRSCNRLITRFATQNERTGFGAGALLIELTRQSVAAGLRPSAEIALLGRTLLALEGVAALLCPELDARDVVREHLASIAARRIAQQTSLHAISRELVDVAALARELPRQSRALLDTLARNRLRVRIAGLEESRLLENLGKIANRISTGLISAALLISAVLALRIPAGPQLLGYPALALVLFVLAFVLAVGIVLSALISDRRVSRYRTRRR